MANDLGGDILLLLKTKLLSCLFGAIWLFVLLQGCGNMAKQMNTSEALYRSKCSSCHNIIAPSRYGKETWRLYIDKYGQKMTDQEKRTVLQYLADR